MSMEIILAWTCVLSVIAFFICLILLFALKGEKAKTAGYLTIGFVSLFILSGIGYIVSGDKKVSSA